MSLKVVMGGAQPSSLIRDMISSGAIHLVDPAKKDVDILMASDISSMTLESPKSVMIACPFSSIRMFPYVSVSQEFSQKLKYKQI